MKKAYVSLFYVVIVALILTSLAMPVYADYILNPGFESGVLSPWYKDGTTATEDPHITSNEKHTGEYSATWVGNQKLRQNFAPITTALITEISFWSYQPELSYVGLQIYFYYSDLTFYAFVHQNNGTGWLKTDVTSYR